MKRLAVLAFSTVVLLLWGIHGHAAELTVSIDIAASDGTIVFELFDSADAFGGFRKPEIVVKFPLDGRDIYKIQNIPPGQYALMVYYDENNNGRIDKNFIGIPREPIGFSNNYQPKGPPSYSRAAFMLKEGITQYFNVKLSRPLGKRGRIGAGVGVIGRSSPYRNYNSTVLKIIPAITYTGDRLQIYGPHVKFSIMGSGKLRLAATGKYRIGVYEEKDSDFLKGMGDRKGTLMAGIALQGELPRNTDISVSYEHDILDRIGGGVAQVELKRSFQSGPFRISPKIGLNWLSSGLSNNDFGVPANKATFVRPQYDTGDTISVEGGLGVFLEITEDWMVIINSSIEILDGKVTDSPIVSDSYVIKGFGAITYIF